MDKGRLKDKKVLFVCSAGGHLAQILELKPVFKLCKYLIVTEDIESNQPLKEKFNIELIRAAGEGYNFEFWKNFFLNIFSALKIILRFNPDVIITTGSHTAIPFCYIGKILRKRIVYILTYARINSKARAANIIYPIANEFIVQWENAQKLYPKSKYLEGGLY